jgi:hypothetical protein
MYIMYDDSISRSLRIISPNLSKYYQLGDEIFSLGVI